MHTEREYVRSLGYILTHYHPLLERPDIPQDLRGKRGVIFGNLEKLYDFHAHYFLPELEDSRREPALMARCFLRHVSIWGGGGGGGGVGVVMKNVQCLRAFENTASINRACSCSVNTC